MIKFLDLQKINEQHSSEFKEVFDKVLNSGWFILGKEVENFENEFAEEVTKVIEAVNSII